MRAATDEEYYAWIGDDDLFRDGGLRTLRDLLDATPGRGRLRRLRLHRRRGSNDRDVEGGAAAQWLLPGALDLIRTPAR